MYVQNDTYLLTLTTTLNRSELFMKAKSARVAQSVERVAFNHNVQGSSPCSGDYYFFCNEINFNSYSFADVTIT